jgi:hypothetical protein
VKTYTLFRQIIAVNGTRTSVPLKVFAKKEDAEKAVDEVRQEYDLLFGPESNTQMLLKGKPTPLRLPDFLMELGVSGVQHSITEHEVHESLVITPRSGIIVPR